MAIACKEHQHIDYVRDVPNKLFPELHNTTNSSEISIVSSLTMKYLG